MSSHNIFISLSILTLCYIIISGISSSILASSLPLNNIIRQYDEVSICNFIGSLLHNTTTQENFDGEILQRNIAVLNSFKSNIFRCWIPLEVLPSDESSEALVRRNQGSAFLPDNSISQQDTSISSPTHVSLNDDFGNLGIGKSYSKQDEYEACFFGCDRTLYTVTSSISKLDFSVLIIRKPLSRSCILPKHAQKVENKSIDCIPTIPDLKAGLKVEHNLEPESRMSFQSGTKGSFLPRSKEFRNKLISFNHNSGSSLSTCQVFFNALSSKFRPNATSLKYYGKYDNDSSESGPTLNQNVRCAVRVTNLKGGLELRSVKVATRNKYCEFGCNAVKYTDFYLTADFIFQPDCIPKRFWTCQGPPIFQTFEKKTTETIYRLPISAIVRIDSGRIERWRIVNLALNRLSRKSGFDDLTRSDFAEIQVLKQRNSKNKFTVILRFKETFNPAF